MGYKRIVTYILESEHGSSVKSANYVRLWDTKGGSWNRTSRKRVDKHPTEPKVCYGVVLEYDINEIRKAIDAEFVLNQNTEDYFFRALRLNQNLNNIDYIKQPMIVSLIDIDSKIPNLALMKLSAYHKSIGDTVGFGLPNADKTYISCVFPQNASKARGIAKMFDSKKTIIGGTGIDYSVKLPREIEYIKPDYSLYTVCSKCGHCVGFEEGISKAVKKPLDSPDCYGAFDYLHPTRCDGCQYIGPCQGMTRHIRREQDGE